MPLRRPAPGVQPPMTTSFNSTRSCGVAGLDSTCGSEWITQVPLNRFPDVSDEDSDGHLRGARPA